MKDLLNLTPRLSTRYDIASGPLNHLPGHFSRAEPASINESYGGKRDMCTCGARFQTKMAGECLARKCTPLGADPSNQNGSGGEKTHFAHGSAPDGVVGCLIRACARLGRLSFEHMTSDAVNLVPIWMFSIISKATRPDDRRGTPMNISPVRERVSVRRPAKLAGLKQTEPFREETRIGRVISRCCDT